MKRKIVKYKDFDWYVLNENEDTVTLFMKDELNVDVVKDICEDETMYDVNRIAHFKVGKEYKWKTSYVRKILNDKFLENYLDKNDLVKIDEDYVRLLKLEEIDWNNNIFKLSEPYWLMTKMGPSRVAYVYGYGDVSSISAGYLVSVRPVINLKRRKK